jgi:hypothetical protein
MALPFAFEGRRWLQQNTAMDCSSSSLTNIHILDYNKSGLKSPKHLLLPHNHAGA